MITYDQWSEKYYSLPRNKRKQFILHSLESKKMVPVFGRLFFPHIIKTKDCPECHHGLTNFLGNNDTGAAIMPRGHSKTTWSRIDLIHDIVYNKEEFIVFVGDAMSAAKRALSFVRNQLETNEFLKEIYGDLVPVFSTKSIRHWNDEHIECTNGVIVLAIGALKGRGLNINAKRPTKALVDDMEDKEAVKSSKQREKYSSWMYETLLPAMDKEKGKVKMIGTVLHFDCLVLNFYRKFGGIKRAAIEDENGNPSLNGKPIWWDKSLLDKRREEIGSFAFAQEYMNDPSTDENSDVKLRWIKMCDEIKLYDNKNQPMWKVYTAVDPSVGMSDKSDETAICTVAREIHNDDIRIVVLNIDHGRWNSTQIVEQSKRCFDRYKHERFGVESVAFQETLRQLLSVNGVPAIPIKAHKDKRSRLQSIVGLIEFGKVQFMPGTEDLITQLVQFPNAEHDDMVDAMVHAIIMAKEQNVGFLSVTL